MTIFVLILASLWCLSSCFWMVEVWCPYIGWVVKGKNKKQKEQIKLMWKIIFTIRGLLYGFLFILFLKGITIITAYIVLWFVTQVFVAIIFSEVWRER